MWPDEENCCGEDDEGMGKRFEAEKLDVGRGKKKFTGFQRTWERRGGLRVLKYILNERRVRLVCGTYLVLFRFSAESKSWIHTCLRMRSFQNTFHWQRRGRAW